MATAGASSEESPGITRGWREVVTSMYPQALSTTYRVPPHFFFRLPLCRGAVPDTSIPAFHLYPLTSTAPPNKQPPRKRQRQKKKKDTDVTQTMHDVSLHTAQPCVSEKSAANQQRGEASRVSMIDSPREQSALQGESTETDKERRGLLWNMPRENPNRRDVRIQESDLQDDFAQNHVLLNLQRLGESNCEVMFILSQLRFKNYGNKPSYAPATNTVFSLDLEYQRGEFDVVIIHRQRGILIGELKSVGLSPGAGDLPRSVVPRKDLDVADKVRKAVAQLHKSETVLKHFLGEVVPDVTIRKTIFLPYVRRSQLVSVLDSDVQLRENLARCLGAPEQCERLVQWCCCHEQLSHPGTQEISSETLANLNIWWDVVMPEPDETVFPDDETYLDVVGSFVGPATTVEVHCNVPPHVEVRTQQQTISEMGCRLQRLVLTPQQVALMEYPPAQTCLTGPPGTGKTVLLVLMALKWLEAGNDVYILCSYPGSLAVSYLMERQLNFTLESLHERGTPPSSSAVLPPERGQVYLKFYDLIYDEGSFDRAIKELTASAAASASLHILMDEAKFTTSDLAKPQTRLFQTLRSRVKNLHFWTACMGNESLPEELLPVSLTVPLRCAPQVQRLITDAMSTFKITPYSSEGLAYYVADGLSVKEINHGGKGHNSSPWPLDCEQCGVEVARELRALIADPAQEHAFPNSPPSLKYSDVFILTRGSNLQDDVTDESGKMTSQCSGAVRGLRREKIPVMVLQGRPPTEPLQQQRWREEVKDAAVAGKNHVIVAHHVIVSGLERKVLVFLPGDSGDYDRHVDEERRVARDKLYVVSRCTTKYIHVKTQF